MRKEKEGRRSPTVVHSCNHNHPLLPHPVSTPSLVWPPCTDLTANEALHRPMRSATTRQPCYPDHLYADPLGHSSKPPQTLIHSHAENLHPYMLSSRVWPDAIGRVCPTSGSVLACRHCRGKPCWPLLLLGGAWCGKVRSRMCRIMFQGRSNTDGEKIGRDKMVGPMYFG